MIKKLNSKIKIKYPDYIIFTDRNRVIFNLSLTYFIFTNILNKNSFIFEFTNYIRETIVIISNYSFFNLESEEWNDLFVLIK